MQGGADGICRAKHVDGQMLFIVLEDPSLPVENMVNGTYSLFNMEEKLFCFSLLIAGAVTSHNAERIPSIKSFICSIISHRIVTFGGLECILKGLTQ